MTDSAAGLPARNLELKARLRSLATARGVAARLATAALAPQTQVDTYFPCPHGRLKLRQIAGGESQLIWYARADDLHPKPSDYRLTRVADGESLRQTLAAACGVAVVVRKRREIWLYHNVRLHLDEVEGLGAFLEFEAVVGPDADEPTCLARLDTLRVAFELTDADLLAGSYSDLLLAQAARGA